MIEGNLVAIEEGGAVYRVDRDPSGGAAVIVAEGSDPAATLAAALTGLLAAVHAGHAVSPDDASLALPLRAERPDLAGVARALAGLLLDEVHDETITVAGVQIDGVVRSDDGLTAWGYLLATAMASPTGHPGHRFAIVAAEAAPARGATTIRLQIRSTRAEG